MKVILKESLCAIFDPHSLRCFKFSQDKEGQAMKFSGWWISGHSRRIQRKFLKCGLMPPKNIQISDKNSYKRSRKICFLPILKPSKLARAIWVGHLILYMANARKLPKSCIMIVSSKTTNTFLEEFSSCVALKEVFFNLNMRLWTWLTHLY